MWHLDHKEGWVFESWCWRILLRVPWIARKSNQSVLKEINPEYSLEGLMLKLQYFGHLMGRADSLEKNPDAGKDWRQKEKRPAEDKMVRQHRWLNGHEFEQTLGDGEGQGSLECCNPWGCTDTTEQLNNNNGHLLHSKQNLNSSTMAKYRSRIYLPLSWPHFVLFFLGLCFGSSNKHFFLDQGPVSLLSTFPW